MAKKYIEVMNDGSQDLTIRDAEAQAAIGIAISVEFVDLGLPSGTLWARCNIGATVETDYGDYYTYGSGSTKYPGGSSYSGRENPLAASADTATQVMGSPWHMPTKAQFEELIAGTTKSWQTDFNGSGVNGMKFTAANGNYIFIPAGGESTHPSEIGVYGNLWTSTPKSSSQVYEFSIRGYNQSAKLVEVGPYFGYNVRGVMEKMSGKANRVIGSTENHIATLDSHGNPKDSGKSVDDFADANHTHDDRYYQKSEIDSSLAGKADKSDTYTKTEVDAKIANVDRKYQVEVAEHTIVFSNSPVAVSNHIVVFY